MRTIILIGVVVVFIAILATCGLTAAPDIRLSAGPYSPESEAQAEVIKTMAPQATAAALDNARAVNGIEQARAAEETRQDLEARQTRLFISTMFIALGAAVAIGLGGGALAFVLVNVVKRALVPAFQPIAPHIVLVRSPGGELRLVDSLTGAVYPLLGDRLPEQLRAENLTRLELAAILAQRSQATNPDGWEVVPALPVREQIENEYTDIS
jgi:hypothetical protein